MAWSSGRPSSARCPPAARISLRRLIEIRPSWVSREQMTDLVKCDPGRGLLPPAGRHEVV
jgi:hypothetical protein